ncbi:MAG: hypothetical protein ACOC2T_03755, partial [Planctomycetota bacterium]
MRIRDIGLAAVIGFALLSVGCGDGGSPAADLSPTVNFDQLRKGETIKPDELRRLYEEHEIPPKSIIEDADQPLHLTRWTEGDFTLWRVAHTLDSPDGRYLVFRSKDNYLADVLFTASRRSPPRADFVPMDGGGLLGLRWESCRGPGVQFYRDSWYFVEQDRAEKVLDVPAQGEVGEWGHAFNRTFESHLAVIPEGDQLDGIGYRYDVLYRPESPDLADTTEPLRSTLRQYWRWEGDKRELTLDKRLSSATTGEVEALFTNGTDG